MKRIGMAVIGFAWATSLWGADLVLEANSAESGAKGQLQVRLAAEQAVATGVQFDVEYDPAKVTLEVAPGRAAVLADKMVKTANPQPNQLRVLVFGINQNVITSGPVAVIQATAVGSDPEAARDSIRIHSVAATDRNGVPVSVTASEAPSQVKPDGRK